MSRVSLSGWPPTAAPAQAAIVRKRSAGVSTIETLFALPVLLLFILAVVEFSYAYRAKSTLNHAAEMVARTGSLTNVCKPAMDRQIIRSLAPLYMDANRSALEIGLSTIQSELERDINIATQLDIVSPTPAIFDAFKQETMLGRGQIGDCGHTTLKPMQLNTVMPNDNLRFRASATREVDGRAINIQDANLLKIRLRHCHELVSPVLDYIIVVAQSLVPDSLFGAEKRVFLTACANGGGTMSSLSPFKRRFIVLTADSIARMQTPVMGRYLGQ